MFFCSIYELTYSILIERFGEDLLHHVTSNGYNYTLHDADIQIACFCKDVAYRSQWSVC